MLDLNLFDDEVHHSILHREKEGWDNQEMALKESISAWRGSKMYDKRIPKASLIACLVTPAFLLHSIHIELQMPREEETNLQPF